MHMSVCNTFTVYTITRTILEGAISSNFLWALSGLLASMSFHLGSVALLEVEISRLRGLAAGSMIFEHSC